MQRKNSLPDINNFNKNVNITLVHINEVSNNFLLDSIIRWPSVFYSVITYRQRGECDKEVVANVIISTVRSLSLDTDIRLSKRNKVRRTEDSHFSDNNRNTEWDSVRSIHSICDGR